MNGPAYNEFSQSLQLFESGSNADETGRQASDSKRPKPRNLRLNLDDIDDMCDHDEESSASARAATFNQFEVSKNGAKEEANETVELDSQPHRAPFDRANASAIELVASRSATEHGMISAQSVQRRTKSIGDGGSALHSKLSEKKSGLCERKEDPERGEAQGQVSDAHLQRPQGYETRRGQREMVTRLKFKKRYLALSALMGFVTQAYQEMQSDILNMACASCLSLPRTLSAEASALTCALSSLLSLLLTCKSLSPPRTRSLFLSLGSLLLLLELLWLALTLKTRSQPDSVPLAFLVLAQTLSQTLTWALLPLGVTSTRPNESLVIISWLYLSQNAGRFIGSLVS